MNTLLVNALKHIGAIAICFLVCLIYFLPQIQGKKMERGDIKQYMGMSQEVRDYKAETGESSLWTNSMFGGMPTYQINTIKDGNLLSNLVIFARGGFVPPIGMFFAAMLCFYIMLVVLGANVWLSVIGAIVFGLTTNNLLLFEAGHESKLNSLTYLPLLIAGVVLAYRNKFLLGGAIFALGVGLNIMANHIQMSYYFFLTLIVYGIIQGINVIRKGKSKTFIKSSSVLLIAGLIAIGCTLSNLLPTYEYQDSTIRGNKLLTIEDISPNPNSSEKGLTWEYSMQWSNGYLDFFASLIPGIVGGSNQEFLDEKSDSFKALRKQGYNVSVPLPTPLYWGSLPFTSGPIYFGAGLCLLFIIGLFLVKGDIKWFAISAVVLTILFSLGKNFELFNRLFFDFVPLFNKFRTPNSVLGVTALFIPLLGIFALHKLAFGEGINKIPGKVIVYSTAGLGLICLFFALLGPSFFDFSNPADASRAPYDVNALISDRKSMMQSDAFRSLFIILLTGGTLYAFVKNRISNVVLISLISIIIIADIWGVGKRYLNKESFTVTSGIENTFTPSKADLQILTDKDANFRVFDVTSDPFTSARTSFFHKSIGGYHAAKLRRYQDIIDRHLRNNNQNVINMLNTRYFITGQSDNPVAQRNPNALGNAWFVREARIANSNDDEIASLDLIDPGTTAVIHEEFKPYLDNLSFDGEGDISLVTYKPNELTYQSNSNSEQLAIFSEVWYGPNLGWQAYMDGSKVDHIRANYILRGMKIPAGSHEIKFEFQPRSYDLGVWLSYIFSSIILVGLFLVIYLKWKQLKNTIIPVTIKDIPKSQSIKLQKNRKKKK